MQKVQRIRVGPKGVMVLRLTDELPIHVAKRHSVTAQSLISLCGQLHEPMHDWHRVIGGRELDLNDVCETCRAANALEVIVNHPRYLVPEYQRENKEPAPIKPKR
jgi:hypothetical protein